jgi:hypothetical protein
MPHDVLIQYDAIRTGLWWSHCCRNILERPDGSSWCATQADAQALADWHTAGETGAPPTSAVTAPDVPDDDDPAEPVQLDLFAA